MSKKVQPFQLLIKPTSFDCNLKCTYCFYLKTREIYPETGRHLMDLDTLEIMIRKYLGLGFPMSIFIWQGGEPTLCGLEFFEKAVALEKKYAKPGQMIGNAFQTNGMLVDENWADFFAENNFLLGLSLDGPESIHNFHRKTAAGGNTYDRVADAAARLRQKKVEFNILAMATRENAGRAGELYRFFRESGFSFLQFIPAFDLEPGTGKLASFSPTPEQYREFLIELFELWWPERHLVSIRDFEWLAAPNYEGRMCIFAESCAPYLAIEHGGDVYPCDFFVREAARLGNLGGEPAQLENFFHMREQKFSVRKKWVSRSCRKCPWLRFCWGGCLRERDCADNPDPKKSIYCEAYSGLFEHAFARLRAK